MRTSLRTTFSAFGSRNYSLFSAGQLVSIAGQWAQTVAQSFLVLELTNSGTALGLSVAARYGPIFLLAPWAGTVIDRIDRRRLLYVTQVAAATVAFAFGILVETGAIRMWMVYLLALILGVVNSFDIPARQAFISDLVPPEQLLNAVTLNSVLVNLGRVGGGAIGGLAVATVGLALCFYLNALSYLAVLVTLLLMKASALIPAEPRPREKGEIRAGLRYVRSSPELLVPLVMTSVIGLLAWEFPISLPLLAKRTFHGNAGTFGTMLAIMGAGAIVGGLVAASRPYSGTRPLAVSAIGWGISITAAALAPTLIIAYVILLFVGYGSLTFNSLNKTVLQLASVPHMRGRVMALWALVWQGSTPIGGPLVGWAGQEYGARWSLLIGGIPTLLVGLIAYPVLIRVDRRARGAPGQPDEAAQPDEAGQHDEAGQPGEAGQATEPDELSAER
jgi:MFS family permease